MSGSGPRTVVFDVGGVIVRWQPLELLREHLGHVEPSRAHADIFEGWAIGSDWREFDLGRVDAETLADRLARRTGHPREAVAALIAAVPAHLQPMADSVALVERLHAAGHRLALLSNMPAPFADHLEATHRVFDRFAHRAWSGRLGLAKPERAIFEHLQDAAGLDPARTLFLDDHAGNVDAARTVGWQALHFTDAAAAAASLEALGWL